jgi:1-phosphatidylinositol-4-phosphate 5-kinase
MPDTDIFQYGFIKKAENFWKGLSHAKSQISPIPPEGYGDRFVKFIRGITKTREEVEREPSPTGPSLETQRHSAHSAHIARNPTEKVMDKAERQARKSERHGANEAEIPDRKMNTVRSPSAERTNGAAGATLPVVEEAGEAGSTSGRSGRSQTESLGQEKLLDHEQPVMSPSPRAAAAAVDGIRSDQFDGIGSMEIGAARSS